MKWRGGVVLTVAWALITGFQLWQAISHGGAGWPAVAVSGVAVLVFAAITIVLYRRDKKP